MICTECDKPAVARGLCQKHYWRKRRTGSVERVNASNCGPCSQEGCDRQSFAKGLCAKHYQQAQHPLRGLWRSLRSRAPGQYPKSWERFEAFLADVGERPSESHQLRRPNHELPWSKINMAWRAPVGGGVSFRAEQARYQWLWHIRKRYDLSEDELKAMGDAQSNRCAICGWELGAPHPETGKPVKVCIDHNHTTLAVRQLLCDYCNKGLGMFRDSPGIVRAAANYMDFHEGGSDDEGTQNRK